MCLGISLLYCLYSSTQIVRGENSTRSPCACYNKEYAYRIREQSEQRDEHIHLLLLIRLYRQQARERKLTCLYCLTVLVEKPSY